MSEMKMSPTTPASSPKVSVTTRPASTMEFPGAMRAVANNLRVTRLEWPNGYFVLLHEGFVKIYTPEDGKYHQLLVSEGDLIATDWVLVDQK